MKSADFVAGQRQWLMETDSDGLRHLCRKHFRMKWKGSYEYDSI